MEDNNVKSEEQIREEVRAEMEKEAQLKDEVRKEMEAQKASDKHTVKKVVRIIWNIVLTLAFIFIAFETIMGVLNMQRLNEDKDPVWYIDSKVEEKDGKKETTYNMGLYTIEKVEDDKETKLMLKPFFIK